MSIASVVVEIISGSGQDVLGRLALMPAVSVFGMTDNQIVTVIEGGSAAAVQGILKEVQQMDNVIGVYPVFVGDE